MSEPKVALITGAGRGIGRDIAQRLAREGYACGLIARTKSQLEETAELIVKAGGKALVTPTDVARRDQVLASVEAVERELGPISVLVNNAGAYLRKPFEEITEEDFDFQLKVNTYGPFFCTQAVVGKMAARGGGTVIFVLGSETRGGPRFTRPTLRPRWRSARSRSRSPTSTCTWASIRRRWMSMARLTARACARLRPRPTRRISCRPRRFAMRLCI